MKIRNSFVSNSSSASFVLKKEGLMKWQLDAVRNHTKYAKELLRWKKEDNFFNEDDIWPEFKEDEYLISGSTSMDNFEMNKFFRGINLPTKNYKFFD